MEPEILLAPVGDNPPKASLYYGHHCLDVLRTLPDNSVNMICTSPPYFALRDYGTEPVVFGGDSSCDHEWGEVSEHGGCLKCGAWRGEMGQEPSPEEFVDHLVEIFRESRRVLREDGQLWLNLGDSFFGGGSTTEYGQDSRNFSSKSTLESSYTEGQALRPIKPRGHEYLRDKDLIGIPWRTALALQRDGWYLRNDIIWHKKNSMPSSVQDRLSCKHEHIFLMTKNARYFFDLEAIRVPFESGSYDENGEHTPSQNWYEKNEGERKIDTIEENLGSLAGSPRRVGRGLFNPGGKNPGDVWKTSSYPYPKAHFATFSPTIPERCIRAGTSEKGYCPVCGAPWERVVNKEKIPDRPNRVQDRQGDSLDEAHGKDGRSGSRHSLKTQTLGWEPTCTCDSDLPLTRGVVLDPFSGSGTTGQVALRLGRDYIGIDRSDKYLSLAKERILDIAEVPTEASKETEAKGPTVSDLFGSK